MAGILVVHELHRTLRIFSIKDQSEKKKETIQYKVGQGELELGSSDSWPLRHQGGASCQEFLIAAAASEPEANEQGSSRPNQDRDKHFRFLPTMHLDFYHYALHTHFVTAGLGNVDSGNEIVGN